MSIKQDMHINDSIREASSATATPISSAPPLLSKGKFGESFDVQQDVSVWHDIVASVSWHVIVTWLSIISVILCVGSVYSGNKCCRAVHQCYVFHACSCVPSTLLLPLLLLSNFTQKCIPSKSSRTYITQTQRYHTKPISTRNKAKAISSQHTTYTHTIGHKPTYTLTYDTTHISISKE
jgi:hypothetical protein